MGLEEVKKDILEKAQAEADRILRIGEQEAKEIMKECDRQIKGAREKADAETAKIIETMDRKERASAEFEAKKMLLERKKEMIEKAFSDAKKSLSDMPEKQRESYIRKLLDRAKEEIEVENVYANEKDKGIIKGMKGIGYKEAGIAGGIIAESKDSSVRVDYSYEEIMDSIEKENLQEIAARLFGK